MPTEMTTGPEGQPHDVMPAEVDVTRCPDCGHPGSYDARVLVAGRGLYRCRNSHCWQDAREQPSSKGVVVVGTGPEPGPSEFTPYPYPPMVGERSGISTRAAQYLDTSAIRAAIRQALHDHQPAGKRYHDRPVAGPAVTKVCRCGHECDGATLAPRTQHLEDVVTAVVLAALCATEESTPTLLDVLHQTLGQMIIIDGLAPLTGRDIDIVRAALRVLHAAGLLPWREET